MRHSASMSYCLAFARGLDNYISRDGGHQSSVVYLSVRKLFDIEKVSIKVPSQMSWRDTSQI